MSRIRKIKNVDLLQYIKRPAFYCRPFDLDYLDLCDSRYFMILAEMLLKMRVKVSSSRSSKVMRKPISGVKNDDRGTTQMPVEASR